MSILYVILAILLFGLLIIVHELGHFTVAKLCGVKVEEFARRLSGRFLRWSLLLIA